MWIARHHWWVVGLAGLLLISFVLFDATHRESSFFYAIEIIIFLIPLLIIGLLLDLLLQEIRNQNRTAKILDYKHKFSQDFSGFPDWDLLVNQLVKFPTSVAEVEQSCLFVVDSISKKLIPVSQWNSNGGEDSTVISAGICEKYLEERGWKEFNFGRSDASLDVDGKLAFSQSYCLPIRYGESMLGILQFKLVDGISLSREQEEIFRNIGDEIGNTLKMGQDRRGFLEMRTSETALAERRSVSDFLHDHLGQNLGYLHFKIDQLISEKDRLSLERVFHDLEHMRSAANESYEVLRGVLETILPGSKPLLTNLLMEHARKVTERSNIQMEFKIKGKPVPVPIEIQRAIFYAFEESLNNVEKHSQADKILVLAEWGKDYLAVTITDNGIGFNPQSVNTDQHFGLEILNERLAKVSGQITLTTSENSGTIVSIRVPNSSVEGTRGIS